MKQSEELQKRLEKGRTLVQQMQLEIAATIAAGEQPLEEKVAMLARYERYLAILEANATK